ncbi:NADAR family protein [Photobacterium kishitanii]|uniref:NADAR domain-containing protein n=1 Tax=Photobacterium kishitanii TaxID=318456 RepID=A0A2T3KLC3_9GAMM|nr:NADAR family protein [Photobacterium kishitanii]PSV00518.1 hypothetical protein C9J27_05130 [Photobacterium kishitanii]
MRVTEQYVFFHGWQDIYSQWYPYAPFDYHGIVFKTAEHWMMVHKVIFHVHRGKSVREIKEIIKEEENFFDETSRHSKNSIYEMLIAPTPKEVKALGKNVTPFFKEPWEEHVPSVLYKGNHLKFTQNQAIFEQFKEMRGKIFVEASLTDRIYGVGLSQDDPRIEDPYNWRGRGLLGIEITKLNRDLFG